MRSASLRYFSGVISIDMHLHRSLEVPLLTRMDSRIAEDTLVHLHHNLRTVRYNDLKDEECAAAPAICLQQSSTSVVSRIEH